MAENKREYEDIEIASDSSEAQIIKKGKSAKKQSKFVKKWRSLKKWQRGIIIAVMVILVIALIAYFAVWGFYNNFRKDVNEENLGISTDIYDKYGKTGVFNVAVFGVDTRNRDEFSGRSDSIIIVSVDKKNKTVKLTSILRDSYVAIDGYKNQKITHAYAFGGAELAIKTINQNFNMDITDYATINFFKMAEAIDILGGIDIEITKSEMEQINMEALGGSQKGAALVDSYGKVHLDGDQATIFCRLRKQDSDEARANRQKMVVNALLAQARKVSPTKYPEVVKAIMGLCETSLTFSEVMSFVPMINDEVTIEAITVPGEPENAVGGIYDGAWVWRYDLAQATQRIHMFIFGEVRPGNNKNSSNKSNKTTTTAPATTKKTDAQKSDEDNGIIIETNTVEQTSETTTAPPDTTSSTEPVTDESTTKQETTTLTAKEENTETQPSADEAA
jgi:LCP family protein required for cell wall assembly